MIASGALLVSAWPRDAASNSNTPSVMHPIQRAASASDQLSSGVIIFSNTAEASATALTDADAAASGAGHRQQLECRAPLLTAR